MIAYIIKVSICWMLFLFLYQLFYKKITFFSANRFYLLSSLILGILIPLAEFLPAIFPSNDLAVFAAPVISGIDQIQIIVNEPSSYTLTWPMVLSIIYLLGLSHFLIKFFAGLYSIYQLKKNNQVYDKGSYYLVKTTEPHLPFSFFDHVFISNQYPFPEKEFDMILSHEKCHINEKHSWDIMFIEITKALFWCSPLIYFYKKEIKQTHEFIADAYCVNGNETKQDYSQLLLQTSNSDLQLSLTNNFFNSFLQKRINTMLNNKSNKMAKLRYLLFLPLLLGLSILFMSQKNHDFIESTMDVSELSLETNDLLSNITYVLDTIPPPPPPPPPITKTPPPPPPPIHPEKVGQRNVIDISEQSQSTDDIFKVVEEMPRFPGCEGMEGDNEELRQCSNKKMLEYIYTNIKYPKEAREKGLQGVVVVQFVIDKNGTVENAKVVRDIGGGAGQEALKVVKSFNDMPERWRAGHQRGKAVKVLYTLPVKFKLQDDVKNPTQVKEKISSSDLLIIVDGKEVSHEVFSKISPNDIQSHKHLGPTEETIKQYGEKAKNGVWLIGLHPPRESRIPQVTEPVKLDLTGGNPNVLVIVDGEEISKAEMEKINPDDIATVEVLKGEKASSYGEKGKNGVVIIKLKASKDPD